MLYNGNYSTDVRELNDASGLKHTGILMYIENVKHYNDNNMNFISS